MIIVGISFLPIFYQGRPPNLKLYTGTGAVNTLSYNASTHVVNVTNSCGNFGGTNITGSFRIGWYLSTNTTISTGDKLIGYVDQTGLNACSYVNRSKTVDLDDITNIAGGTNYVGVYFDYTNAITESEETDNTAYWNSPTVLWPVTLTVSPSNRSVSNASGSTTFSVTSNTSWTVSDDASWLTVSPGSGSNNGTLTATYTENTTTSQRVGTITVIGDGITRTVTVTQAPILQLTVSPSNRSVSSASGSTTFSVTSNTSWTVSDDASWLTVSPGSGSNNGTLTATYTENTTTSQRVGTITVVGGGITRTVTVTQAPILQLTVSPSNRSVSSASGSTTFSVTSNTSWTVTDDASWLTVSPGSGSNNGTLTATYTENTTTSQRVGTITVIGGGITRTVTVTQAPILQLTVSPSNRSVSSASGSTTFSVTSNTSWTVSDDASWLTVSPGSGSNNGTLTATYTENTTTSQRVGTITVIGGGITRTVTVTQDPASGIPLNILGASTVNNGQDFELQIQIGDATNPVTDLKVISFDLMYLTQYVDYVI